MSWDGAKPANERPSERRRRTRYLLAGVTDVGLSHGLRVWSPQTAAIRKSAVLGRSGVDEALVTCLIHTSSRFLGHFSPETDFLATDAHGRRGAHVAFPVAFEGPSNPELACLLD